MIVRVYSRKQAKEILFFDTPVISIRDEGVKKLRVKGTNVLHVVINDNKTSFDISDATAREIAEFVHKNRDAKIMSVNCMFGSSRSAAVALAICEHFGLNFKNPTEFYQDYGYVAKYSPNGEVYLAVRSALRDVA